MTETLGWKPRAVDLSPLWMTTNSPPKHGSPHCPLAQNPMVPHVVLRPVYPSVIRRRLGLIRLFTTCLQCARLLPSVLMGLVQVIVKGGSAALFALFDKKRARGSLCTIVGGVAKLLWMQPLRGGQSYGLGAAPLDATGGV
jgi:hypothetical protein